MGGYEPMPVRSWSLEFCENFYALQEVGLNGSLARLPYNAEIYFYALQRD